MLAAAISLYDLVIDLQLPALLVYAGTSLDALGDLDVVRPGSRVRAARGERIAELRLSGGDQVADANAYAGGNGGARRGCIGLGVVDGRRSLHPVAVNVRSEPRDTIISRERIDVFPGVRARGERRCGPQGRHEDPRQD